MIRPASPLASPLFTSIAALVAAGGIAALVACGGAMKSPASVTATDAAAPPLSGRPDDLRDRIRELDATIEANLQAAALEAPDAAAVAAVAGAPMADVRTTCTHVPSDRCEDVCTLSGSICDSAASICDLAAQLPGDAWAEERCAAGKASCKRATERCCSGDCAAQP